MARGDRRDRAGERIGTLGSPCARLPLVVRDRLMLCRIDPVMTDLPGEGRVEHGSCLIAHHCADDKARWTFDALDRRCFGPLSP